LHGSKVYPTWGGYTKCPCLGKVPRHSVKSFLKIGGGCAVTSICYFLVFIISNNSVLTIKYLFSQNIPIRKCGNFSKKVLCFVF
jgi:hypothetical protein